LQGRKRVRSAGKIWVQSKIGSSGKTSILGHGFLRDSESAIGILL